MLNNSPNGDLSDLAIHDFHKEHNMYKRKTFLTLSTVLIVIGWGCSRSQSDSTFGSVQERGPAIDSTRLVNNSPFHPLACEILDGFPKSIDRIKGNSRLVLNGDDSCVLRLIDSISQKFIKERDPVYIAALDSLIRVSDGYVSDYLDGISYDIFMKALPGYVAYMEKIDYDSKMRQLLVYGLQEELDVDQLKGESVADAARRKEDKLDEVRSTVRDAEAKLSPQEKKYLVDVLTDAGIRQ